MPKKSKQDVNGFALM